MANTENNKKNNENPMAGAGSESRFCPNCGSPRKPDSVYCYECGFKLEAGEGTQEIAGEGKEAATAATEAERALPKDEIAPVPSEKPPPKPDEAVVIPVAGDQPTPVAPPPPNIRWYNKPLWVGCGIVGGVITLGLIVLLVSMGTCLCLAPNASSRTQTTTPSQLPASTGPEIEYFTASCPEPSPTVIVSGQTCGLSWSVTGPADTTVTILPNIGTVELSGMVKVERGGIYTIKATSKEGLAVKSITVR